MEITQAVSSIFSAFGLSSSAGLNAYIPIFFVSLLARFDNLLLHKDIIKLGENFSWMESWWFIGAIFVLGVIEFFADKIPAVNHVNDALQTFVRPVAGAILFAASTSVITDMHPVLAGLLGLFTSGTVHVAKSAVMRPAITAVSGGAATPVVSLLEDIVAAFVAFLSIVLPALIIFCLVVFLVWFIARTWRKSQQRGYVG